ncbi:hypothetical protein SAY87_001196 [Trapa incisa]|uniref:Uncharacterized protein n=1 Tax=Trapa incisa TaxID=236973 RepID=A0AAN7GCU3_9MYRT|nr:hypothetical protein SAY87_001196 [Trapa incisa]
MEVALEMEDDLFFADLSKQISLLIAEEEDVVEEEEPVIAPYWDYASSLQGFTGSIYNPAAPSLVPVYHQINCPREIISKGTGVFIPKSSHPRRKTMQGKSNSSSRPHRQGSDHHYHHQSNGLTRSGPPQLPHKTPFHRQKF